MYNYLKDNTAPNDPRMVKRIQNNTSRYVINDGLLYHIWHFKANDTLQSQICTPEVYYTEIMQALHDLKKTRSCRRHENVPLSIAKMLVAWNVQKF